jgi:hypothetical protein
MAPWPERWAKWRERACADDYSFFPPASADLMSDVVILCNLAHVTLGSRTTIRLRITKTCSSKLCEAWGISTS